jgi:hypothetical protein
MLRDELREKVVAKLTNARCEIEDALNLSTAVARYDPVVIPASTRNRLSAMIDELNGVLRQIEGSQWRASKWPVTAMIYLAKMGTRLGS